MFELKKPCPDCPFRKGGRMINSLGHDDMQVIVKNIVKEDGFFSCHKTIDYGVEGEGLQSQNKYCAGALIALEKADALKANRNTRIAVGFGLFNPDELQDKEDVIDPKEYL